GIREIELIAQSLQVLHGTESPELRERNTLRALQALRKRSLLSVEECDSLTLAYIFLRDIENKLQMANDAQTHSLPQDRDELTVCTRTLGYTNVETFLHDYRHYTSQVNAIFERRFSSNLI